MCLPILMGTELSLRSIVSQFRVISGLIQYPPHLFAIVRIELFSSSNPNHPKAGSQPNNFSPLVDTNNDAWLSTYYIPRPGFTRISLKMLRKISYNKPFRFDTSESLKIEHVPVQKCLPPKKKDVRQSLSCYLRGWSRRARLAADGLPSHVRVR